MGMFDYVICEHPLPDGRGPDGLAFQTKDTPAQLLEYYTITADGRLLFRHVERKWVEEPGSRFGGYLHELSGTEELHEVPFHGDIEFYASNVCMSGPDGVATEDDRPPYSLSYTARFTNGRLEWIRGGEDVGAFAGTPHLKRDEMHRRFLGENGQEEPR